MSLFTIDYLLLVDFSFEDDDFDVAAFDSLFVEELLPFETEVPDLEEDELLAGVLTDRDGVDLEPEVTEGLLLSVAGCSTLLFT
jgi:hypothetical protein